MAVLLETTLGDIVVDVYVKERPKSSLNFIKLCKMKYYNLCQFHTIEQNYIAQTGDPTGTGRGGESIFMSLYGEQARYFEKEDLPKMKHTRMGKILDIATLRNAPSERVVSFVNNGNNMLGSQFFITLSEGLDYLDDKHTIFGQVTEGLDTLERLNDQLCDDENKPYRDIRIAHTIVLDDPFEDPPRLKYPRRSPSPTFEMLVKTNQIALDENIDDYEGKTAEEIAEEMKKREMAEQAQILEMIGDLREADEAPPDNVLFVCKLNPVTTDEDLEIIFSRFGKIIKCEIIRDRRTKQSLQYAFIEFEDPKSCEQAFFKMDNVLIDDRRIHVDFSQSVAKLHQWDRGAAKDTDSVKEEDGRKKQKPRESYGRDDFPRKYSPEKERWKRKRRQSRSPIKKRERSPERKRKPSISREEIPRKFQRRSRSNERLSRKRRSREASKSKGTRDRSCSLEIRRSSDRGRTKNRRSRSRD